MPTYAPTNKPEKNELGAGVDSLHPTTKRLLCFEKKLFLDTHTFEKNINAITPTDSDSKVHMKNTIIKTYSELFHHHQNLINEEKLISRMERNAHIRNIIFRGITTLVIGFSIMFVYWTADFYGIPMPLLRLGM